MLKLQLKICHKIWVKIACKKGISKESKAFSKSIKIKEMVLSVVYNKNDIKKPSDVAFYV